MEIKVLHSQTVFHGRVFDVRQDELQMPDGRSASIDVIAHNGAVTMLPIDDQGMVWFVRQYRHAAGVYLLELPAGVAEEDETPEANAQRELREEIGMAARNMLRIGGFYLAPGYSTEFMHVFLARDLYPSPLPGDENEFLSVEKLPIHQALELAETGQLQDSKSLVALLWARPHLVKAGLL